MYKKIRYKARRAGPKESVDYKNKSNLLWHNIKRPNALFKYNLSCVPNNFYSSYVKK